MKRFLLKRNRSRQGFTLIEVLIALALVSTLMIGAMEILIHSLRVEIKAARHMEITGLASARIDSLRISIWADGASGNPPGTDFTIAGRRGVYYLGTCHVDTLPDALTGILIKIWSEASPGEILSVKALLSRDLGF